MYPFYSIQIWTIFTEKRALKKKLSLLKHPDCGWSKTMMSLHKVFQWCQSQILVKHKQTLFPHFSQCSPFCHPSQTQLDSSRHASASAAAGPEKVMPPWPLWSPLEWEWETENRETCNSQLWTCGHCGICLWKGLSGMMYCEVRLAKVSEPVIYRHYDSAKRRKWRAET